MQVGSEVVTRIASEWAIGDRPGRWAMRFRPLPILVGAAVVMALSAGGALAVIDTLDQHQDTHDAASGVDAGDFPTAQTFTAGQSGVLDRVSLFGTMAGSSRTIRIETVDANGHPTGTLLSPGASTTADPLDGWFDATFASGPSVVSGSKYAIVVGSSGFFMAGGTCTNAYAGGEALANDDSGWALVSSLPDLDSCVQDFAFRTYIVGASVAAPTISAGFAAPSMMVGQGVALRLTLSNSAGNGALTGLAFTDTLPSGLSVSSGSTTVCGGTVTTTAPHGIAFSGGSLADGAQCQIPVMVTGSAVGSYTTTTGAVSSTEGGTGNTATASIGVDAYPTIAAAFSPSSVAVGATAQLTFTITDPAGNPDALHFIDLSDTLPAGVTVATAAAVTTCSGSVTVTAPSSIVASAISAAVGSPCVFSVPVHAAVAGSFTSTVAARLGGFTFPGNSASAVLGVTAAAATPVPTATPAPTATRAPTATTAPTPPATNTVGSGGSGNGAPLSALFVLMAAAGFGAASLTLGRKARLR